MLSAFQLEFSDNHPEGFLVSCEPQQDRGNSGRLKDYRNPRERWCEEKHLEEWIIRRPQAIFPDQEVLVLNAEKYRQLPEKTDILVIDAESCFQVLELKINPVAVNGTETPYRIHNQMKRYVNFFGWFLEGFPVDFRDYYASFAERFHAERRSLDVDLRTTFGEAYPDKVIAEPIIREVYVTEGYDDASIEYIRGQPGAAKNGSRLIYYRFFPRVNQIEFWEVPS